MIKDKHIQGYTSLKTLVILGMIRKNENITVNRPIIELQ